MKKFLVITIIFLSFIFLYKNPALAEEEILILFDASTSMSYQIGDEPKYVHMVRVVKRILSRTNPSQKIGLRIIGIPMNSKILNYLFDFKLLCRATELLNPISSNNIQPIVMNLDSIFPLGLSPITYSLATAITHDFTPSANPKHIILVTDGAEGCDQDPCQYIKEITSVRKDIKIDIIAIGVEDSNEIKQLHCIANASGGEVKSVKTPEEMDAAFMSVMAKFSSYSKFSMIGSPQQRTVRYKNYMFETYE